MKPHLQRSRCNPDNKNHLTVKYQNPFKYFLKSVPEVTLKQPQADKLSISLWGHGHMSVSFFPPQKVEEWSLTIASQL